jgi:hypothetical protein
VSERFSPEVTAEFQEADVIDYTHKSAVFGRILRALAVCVLAAGACAGSALADSQYTYTGKAFTSFGGGDSCPTTCSISGSFTLATAIGPDNIVFFIMQLFLHAASKLPYMCKLFVKMNEAPRRLPSSITPRRTKAKRPHLYRGTVNGKLRFPRGAILSWREPDKL